MSRRAQTACLTVAALGSLAFAGVRIGHAARSSSVPNYHIPVYTTTPAAEAATLAAVRIPAGFHRSRPCDDGVCLVRVERLPLDVPTARRLIEATGVNLAHRWPPHPVECGALGLGNVCKAEGTIGTETVMVWVQRPEVRTNERRTPGNRRTFHAFRLLPETEVQVGVIGHCRYPKECAAMQREEEDEAVARSR
jgi:hypothetical protein